MSLEELRAQAEQEDEQQEEGQSEAEATEEPEETAESEEEAEGETEQPEESDDLELELDGEPEPDQQKPSAEEALVHKLTKQRKKRQEVEGENETLKQRLEALEKQLHGGQQSAPAAPPQGDAAEPKIPDLYDDGIDGDRQKYDKAMKDFFVRYQQYQNRHQQAEQQQEQYQEQVKKRTQALAERAAKFSKDNNVNVDRVANALDKATSEIDEATGIDGALTTLLDSVGDGSEKVAYYIGTNEGAMAKVKQLLQEDPNGFKAIAYMTRQAEKLRPKHTKQVSKAPEPDEPLKGDSSKGSAQSNKVQAMWDKADTPQKMMEARKKARELGVKLDT